METAGPLVSVIVPTYNRGSRLSSCLESVRGQSEPGWECIVVEDGSSQPSNAVVEGLQAADPRFRYLQQPNAGAGTARNTGAAHARGRWLLFLDADDQVLPNCLRILTKVALQTPEAELVTAVRGGPEITQEIPGGNFDGSVRRLDSFLGTVTNGICAPAAALDTGSTLLLRERFQQIGGFLTDKNRYPNCEDWQFWVRLSAMTPVHEIRAYVARTESRNQGKHHKGLITGTVLQSVDNILTEVLQYPEVARRLLDRPQEAEEVRRGIRIYHQVILAAKAWRAGDVESAVRAIQDAGNGCVRTAETDGVVRTLKYYLSYPRDNPLAAARGCSQALMSIAGGLVPNQALRTALRNAASDSFFLAARELAASGRYRDAAGALILGLVKTPGFRSLKSLISFLLRRRA